MNIMVFDVSAEYGGALSILKDFYEAVKEYNNEGIIWYFVLSGNFLKETKNIKMLLYPWIKKSWLHRLYFDRRIAPKLVEKYNIDKVYSMQSIMIKTKKSQTVYIHQSVQFSEYSFSLFKDKTLWIYQNVISRAIFKTIKEAEQIIVQTKWMKDACIKKVNVDEKKIKVIPPSIISTINKKYKHENAGMKTFFYPAGPLKYKNHSVIAEACDILVNKGISNFEVIFTLSGNENAGIISIYEKTAYNRLPIKFAGTKSRDEVFSYYSHSILLFPSYIESFGLPLLEARLHRTIIIASDCPFSHEILDGYANSYFFNPFKAEQLADTMANVMNVNYYTSEITERLDIYAEDNGKNIIDTILGKLET